MLSAIFLSAVASAEYPQYLNGDRNYILFDGFQGGARYVCRNSLSVESRNVISIGWVYAEDGKITVRQNVRFGYDLSARKIYFVTDGGDWKLIEPEGSRASGSAMAGAAEIAFCLAYGEKFLGIYPDKFYDFMR